MYIYIYIFYVHALHVSAAQGHLQATHLFTESIALCTLSIVLLQHVVVIINFGVMDVYSSYLMYCGRSVHHLVCRSVDRVYLVFIHILYTDLY
jgi:hypothetical protein